MEQVKQILDGSYLWRLLSVLCLWCGRQWQNSRVVQWFLHPAGWVARGVGGQRVLPSVVLGAGRPVLAV